MHHISHLSVLDEMRAIPVTLGPISSASAVARDGRHVVGGHSETVRRIRTGEGQRVVGRIAENCGGRKEGTYVPVKMGNFQGFEARMEGQEGS